MPRPSRRRTEHAHGDPGQHWREPDRVRDFVARMDARAQERLPQFELMTQLLGRDGADGLRIGGERLAEFEGRYRYVTWNFGDGTLPDELDGPFDAVISSAAIHHLPEDALKRLYGEVLALLAPGGAFLNLDLVLPPDEGLVERYRQLMQAEQDSRDEPPPPSNVRRHHSNLEPSTGIWAGFGRPASNRSTASGNASEAPSSAAIAPKPPDPYPPNHCLHPSRPHRAAEQHWRRS